MCGQFRTPKVFDFEGKVKTHLYICCPGITIAVVVCGVIYVKRCTMMNMVGSVVKDIYWWRRPESNRRPRNFRLWIYMLSRFYLFNYLLPERQGKQTTIPVKF